ncbi:peptidoglycan DD-metalloendopeptidase family protein [Nocardia uniformis]|uniref:Peptidoglycan DD-metalloendopeptidase family protein n=1 Tax=Nocardia uniformis TaxID=53432 RepID=A0A849CIM9_9NOCA|nr:M23 family metallopeptidase [Nocardia uniformis]NNH73841.1 peptidoglycan DD-metalloendopeptidase family protein [Nocardia uniformis]
MAAPWAVLVPVVAIVAMTALILGSGDRAPERDGCLPDMPRPVRQPTARVVMPLPEGTYSVSSGFGPREGEFHQGVDLAAAQGTAILAATDGEVTAAGPADGFGNWIIVDTDFDGQRLSTVYGHIFDDDVNVSVGDQVSAGQRIAAVGSAGISSGPHLHFEVVPGGRLQGGDRIDPMAWLERAGAPTSTTHTTLAAERRDGPVSSRARLRWAAAAGFDTGCEPVAVAAPGPELRPGVVPPEYEPWIRRAAGTCPEITAPLLGGLLRQESGFNRFAVSPAGAAGPAQFMPGTWASNGIDGDGDGRIEVTSIPDAVMSAARHSCDLIEIAKSGVADGRLRGDLIELWLSMYNCGPGGTFDAGGVCQNAETQHYVKAVPEWAAGYALTGDTTSTSYRRHYRSGHHSSPRSYRAAPCSARRARRLAPHGENGTPAQQLGKEGS